MGRTANSPNKALKRRIVQPSMTTRNAVCGGTSTKEVASLFERCTMCGKPLTFAHIECALRAQQMRGNIGIEPVEAPLVLELQAEHAAEHEKIHTAWRDDIRDMRMVSDGMQHSPRGVVAIGRYVHRNGRAAFAESTDLSMV